MGLPGQRVYILIVLRLLIDVHKLFYRMVVRITTIYLPPIPHESFPFLANWKRILLTHRLC